jgi:thiosulfate/3-mercaptopyruvate sulfurtransferase
MTLTATIRANELLDRLATEKRLPADLRRLRIYDTTVTFRRTDSGMVAAPDREAFEEGHIPTAHFVDHQADLSDAESPLRYTLMTPQRLGAALRAIGINNDSIVVFYSTQHIMWATRAWWILRSCGFEKVYVLDGGFDAWRDLGADVHRGRSTESYGAGDLTVEFSPRFWADKSEVQASIGDGSVCTINALSASSYRGTSKVNYGRPGHIAGSVNVPYQDFLTEGFLRPEGQLRELFERQGAFARDRVVTYCGGGIAATLAAFTLDQLGHQNVGVYDGSLSEWSADPELPMATGEL